MSKALINMRAILLPLFAFMLLLIVWEYWVVAAQIPKFILPAPSLIFDALVTDFDALIAAAAATLKISMIALFLAIFTGVLLALGFSLSRTFEQTFYPVAVIMQVTPIVSVAPLILIWVGIDNVERALIIISWLAAFFPILSNMSAGLKSVDPNLNDLFKLYNASRWQRFWKLLWPSALPYLLSSLKISGGLALIGSVVAEFVAGSGGSNGLAWRILEAGNRLQVEKMFAGLILLAVMGILIFYSFSYLEYRLLRKWHPGYS